MRVRSPSTLAFMRDWLADCAANGYNVWFSDQGALYVTFAASLCSPDAPRTTNGTLYGAGISRVLHTFRERHGIDCCRSVYTVTNISVCQPRAHSSLPRSSLLIRHVDPRHGFNAYLFDEVIARAPLAMHADYYAEPEFGWFAWNTSFALHSHWSSPKYALQSDCAHCVDPIADAIDAHVVLK